MRHAWMSLVLIAGLLHPACGGAGEGPPQGRGERPATAAWGRVLERGVIAGGVDYRDLAADRGDLDAYLDSLRRARPAAWSDGERKAFWINAYNAVVVHHVLGRYPGIGSVQEVDGFFDELTFPVAGERLTLDEIEGRARDLGDARVHFAVVCASTSCPDLRDEPYRGEAIGAQLQEMTHRFLADPEKGLRYEAERNTLWLSSIFKWYADDFTGGSRVVAFFLRDRIVDWVLPQLPDEGLARTIERRGPAVRYLDYDWGLNDRSGQAARSSDQEADQG